MKFNLMYYHRLPFPSASGQTIAIIRDFFAISRLIGAVHLFYRSPKAFDEKSLNRLLKDYGGQVDEKFHFHCIQDGWFGKKRTMNMASSLIRSSRAPFFIVARTFQHIGAGICLRKRHKDQMIKAVMELHQDPFPHIYLKKENRPIKAFRRFYAAKKTYMQADALLCNTKAQIDYLKKLFPGHALTKYLPSGCPDSFFSNGEKKASAKGNDSKIRIRYAGRLSSWKNPIIMFEALQLLPDNYVLDIAGGKLGDEEKSKRQIEEMARRFHVRERVNYFGFLPPLKVADFLKGADCLVLPLGQSPEAKLFTSPLKLFEYAASARPMAVTRVPSTQNLIRDGEHAVMAAPGSASDTASAIEKIVKDKDLASRIVRNARNWAKKYSVSNRAVEYVAFLDSLLS